MENRADPFNLSFRKPRTALYRKSKELSKTTYKKEKGHWHKKQN